MAEMAACVRAVYNAPEMAPIRAHVPFTADAATPQQLSDQSFATPKEVQVIASHHATLQSCRLAMLDRMAQTEPVLVPVLTASYRTADDDRMALTQRKITWGEYVHRFKEHGAATRAALQAAESLKQGR